MKRNKRLLLGGLALVCIVLFVIWTLPLGRSFVNLSINQEELAISTDLNLTSYGVTLGELKQAYPCVSDIRYAQLSGLYKINFTISLSCYKEAESIKNLFISLDGDRVRDKFMIHANRQDLHLNLGNGTTFSCYPQWVPQINKWAVLC